MGRLIVEGPDMVKFLQHVLTSNVEALDLNKAQYCIIPNEKGEAIDDAYLYRFSEDRYLLIVNAGNTDKDLEHLCEVIKDYDCTLTNITADWASIAVKGPKSKEILTTLNGGEAVTEPWKNALNHCDFEGHEVYVAKTGYTGEPLGYEVFVKTEDCVWLWKRLEEL
jgi:aminomethyltransferase